MESLIDLDTLLRVLSLDNLVLTITFFFWSFYCEFIYFSDPVTKPFVNLINTCKMTIYPLIWSIALLFLCSSFLRETESLDGALDTINKGLREIFIVFLLLNILPIIRYFFHHVTIPDVDQTEKIKTLLPITAFVIEVIRRRSYKVTAQKGIRNECSLLLALTRLMLDVPTEDISLAESATYCQDINTDVLDINTQPDLAVLEVKSLEGLPRIHTDGISDTRLQNANEFKKAHDNTLSEQMVDNMSVKMKSVGAIISSNSVIGTVFRVGSKYVMTALHVVKRITNPRKLSSIADNNWSKLDDPTVYIRFTASVLDLRRPIFHIKPDVIYMNKQLDIAILELKSLEGLPGSLKLSKYMGHMECVNIIGFGHPIDPRKRLDANCEVLNINHIKTDIDYYFNANPSVLQLNGLKPGGIKGEYKELDNAFMFPCHTFFEQGSSGAPAVEENEVVGILVKGIPASYYELRDSPYFTASGIDKLPKNLMFELCIKTESIFKDMNSVVPMLAAELFN